MPSPSGLTCELNGATLVARPSLERPVRRHAFEIFHVSRTARHKIEVIAIKEKMMTAISFLIQKKHYGRVLIRPKDPVRTNFRAIFECARAQLSAEVPSILAEDTREPLVSVRSEALGKDPIRNSALPIGSPRSEQPPTRCFDMCERTHAV